MYITWEEFKGFVDNELKKCDCINSPEIDWIDFAYNSKVEYLGFYYDKENNTIIIS